MRKYARLAAWLAAAVMLTGCAGKEGTTAAQRTSEETEKIQIGFSFDSFVIERWVRDRDVFVSTAQSLGAEVNVQNAGGSVEEQIAQIRYLIKKNVDVLAIVAIDADSLKEVVEEAHEAGIPVICYDRLLRGSGADLYVSFDNEMVGELMGEALRRAIPEGGSIYAVYGSESDNNVAQVEEGLKQSLEDSNLSIVYSTYCSNWLAELAFDAVSEGLKLEPNVAGIMCGNDDLASQAIRALSEHRMAGNVKVVAQDAELSACQRIVEGTQEMTVFKPVDELADAAARLAVDMAQGKDITDDEGICVDKTINDTEKDIPYFSIEPVAVTKENIDDVIIASGFHSRDDVYLNVK